MGNAGPADKRNIGSLNHRNKSYDVNVFIMGAFGPFYFKTAAPKICLIKSLQFAIRVFKVIFPPKQVNFSQMKI